MNPTASHPAAVAALDDLSQISGRIVLVRSSRDHRNPPTAMRGWMEIPSDPSPGHIASIVVEFPQMFASRAHHRTFPLGEDGLSRLLASERDGAFEFTIDDELT